MRYLRKQLLTSYDLLNSLLSISCISCNHAMAKEIKGPPPGFVQWLCKKQLYLVQEISFHLLFQANCCQIVGRGRGAEERLLSVYMLAGHSQRLVLKGQSDPQAIYVVRATKWSQFRPQQKEVTFSVLFSTLTFSSSILFQSLMNYRRG